MFGGHSIFLNTKVLEMINPKGCDFFKVDDGLKAEFAAAVALPRSKMPKYRYQRKCLTMHTSWLIELKNQLHYSSFRNEHNNFDFN